VDKTSWKLAGGIDAAIEAATTVGLESLGSSSTVTIGCCREAATRCNFFPRRGTGGGAGGDDDESTSSTEGSQSKGISLFESNNAEEVEASIVEVNQRKFVQSRGTIYQ
jgi:hypothetical protein